MLVGGIISLEISVLFQSSLLGFSPCSHLAKLTFGKVLLSIRYPTDIYISWREGEAGKKIKLLCPVILII